MKILITGSVGTEKKEISKRIGKKLKFPVIHELEFCKKKRIGRKEKKELVVPLEKLKKEMLKEIKKHKNLIIEGHLLCEIRLPVQKIFLIRSNLKLLEKRLKKRKYSDEKILDNLFCEETNYCGKKLLKKYKKSLIFEVKSEKNLNNTVKKIIKRVKKK